MAWERLIRFKDPQGEVRYGEPVIDNADEGSSISDLEYTSKTSQVAELLGPLTPSDIPPIKCVGLNYAKHIREAGRSPPPYSSISIKEAPAIAGWNGRGGHLVLFKVVTARGVDEAGTGRKTPLLALGSVNENYLQYASTAPYWLLPDCFPSRVVGTPLKTEPLAVRLATIVPSDIPSGHISESWPKAHQTHGLNDVVGMFFTNSSRWRTQTPRQSMLAILLTLLNMDMNAMSPKILLSVVVLWIIYHAVCYMRDPLKSVPGPFLARFTRLWYLGAIWGQKFHEKNILLHQRYGPIVRIAPNYYSIDDKDAIKIIYGLGTKFVKGDWYLASAPARNVERDLFTEQNTETHAHNRRKVAALYSMTNLVGMEPHVHQCTEIFIARLSEMATSKTPLNLQVWLQYWAFDTIALITLYKRFGFLDHGDSDGLIPALHSYLVYSALVGVFAEWHRFLSWIRSIFPVKGIHYMGDFVAKQVVEGRIQREKTVAQGKKAKSDDDFLTKCLRMHAQNPDKFTVDSLFTTLSSNIIAGSDTTSISATGIMDCLIRNPDKLSKLRQEVDKTIDERDATTKMLTFAETQKLPYLQACIKEGIRMHPATGLPFVRVVPEGGSVLAGRYIPAKSQVGVNSWVIHANQEIWGPDADQFRPERWLESAESANELNRYFMSFGSGARTCIGKNISLLEISIMLPELVRRFDWTLVDPEEPLESKNNWFVKQQNLNCVVSFRERV